MQRALTDEAVEVRHDAVEEYVGVMARDREVVRFEDDGEGWVFGDFVAEWGTRKGPGEGSERRSIGAVVWSCWEG